MKKTERVELIEISLRMMRQVTTFPVATFSQPAADMRLAIGKYMGNFTELTLEGKLVGTELFDCFEKARIAGATLATMDRVRTTVLAENPRYQLSVSVINAAIIFSFVEQVHIICAMQFKSRTEVDAIINKMVAIIETVKLERADHFFVSDYQNFVQLSALLIQHLSDTERKLPQVINMSFPVHYPALALANRIYGDGSRSEELIAENKTVHPAFMPRDIRGLSQ